MSMTTSVIKKFVEEDYKDCVILVTCDNEHTFFHRAHGNPDIIWDWNNETFTAFESQENIIDQYGHPMQVTTVSLEEIQFLTAYVDSSQALEFINNKYTTDEEKTKAKEVLQKVKPGMMGPKTLAQFDPSDYKYK